MSKRAPMTDLQMMQQPLEWPKWPLLPLKRQKGFDFEFGFLAAQGLPRVYLSVIYHLKDKVDLSELPTKEYESFDALAADGWKVD